MTSRIGKGLRKHIPNGQDEARTARSGLRPTDRQPTAVQRTTSSQVGLDDSLKVLAERVTQVEGASESGLAHQLETVTQQVEQVKGENDELRAFFQEALQEAERLKKENEELRKLGEDAVLDQQLSKALQETDKLKLAADAYKKELLQQKVTELQSELAQTSKRLKGAEDENLGLTQAMKGAKAAPRSVGMGARTDSLRSLDRQSTRDADPSARQAVLSRLQAPSEDRGDVEELLAAAAEALKVAGAAEAQLADAVAANAKLQAEVDQLNDTVFSKTFRAPSAWAEREVKYKMDKKAWDTQVERLQNVINKLKAENTEYRNNNKTDQFEARIQGLEKVIQETEGAKVTAQRALHELQLDMQAQVQKYTQLEQARRHQDASADEGVSSRIQEFDRQPLGTTGSAKPPVDASATGRQAKRQGVDAAGPADDAAQQEEAAAAAPGTHVQDVIVDMNAHHIGTQQPAAAPQDESDTHLHNQATPDVISSTPNAIPTPSSQHPVQQSHPVQLPQADSAYGVDPVSSTKGSRDGLAAVADSFQQSPDTSLASAQVSNQQPSTAAADTAQESHAHQQPASGPTAAAPADITAFASQLATEANASDQSQGSAGQLQQPAGNATSTSAQASSTSQQQHQPGELGLRPMQQHQDAVPSTAHQHSPSPSAADASQQASGGAAKIPASYQHQGFNPTDVPSQSEPHQAADPVQGRSDAVALAQPAAESVSTSKAPGVQLEGSSESRQGNAGQPETSPSQNVASQSSGARQQLDQPSTSRDEAASEGQNQMTSQTSQDDASASTSERQQPGDASVSRADRQEAVSDTEAADTAASESSNRRAEQNGTSGREDDNGLPDDSGDDLLTLAHAVHHVARFNRQSRANSSEALDELEAAAGPSDYPAPPTPVAPPTQPQAAPRVTFEDAGHLSLAGTTARGGAADLNVASTLSEASEQWTAERVQQLEEDKAAIERLWGEHAQENDIGVLKFKLAEFESRCEMYEAQVTKMQRSMERSDQDKARVEEQLATAMALNHSGDKQGLAAMRERLHDVVTGRSSKTSQLEERLKEAEEQLQHSYREQDRLEKQRAKLEHELASWSAKLGVDIQLPKSDSVDGSDASASSKGRVLTRWRSSASGFGVDGLSEGEVEVMHLREENEALMDSLVRTKVDLAETEGEYLKTKRSLIRANERLASLSERVDSLKAALNKAGVPLPGMTDSPSARSDTSTNPFGTPRSVMGTPKSAAAQALDAHL